MGSRRVRRGSYVVVPHEGDDQLAAGWTARLQALRRHPEGVFSDEKLLGSPYDGYRLAPERVAMVASALRGLRFQVVLYVRPQIDWLPSLYLQSIQVGQTDDPHSFWSRIADAPFLSWVSLVRLLESTSEAERVVVRAYVPGRDVVTDFLTVLGMQGSAVKPFLTARENRSITAAQAPILLGLNRDSSLTQVQRTRLRNVLQAQVGVDHAPVLSPFPLSLQQEIRTAYRDDWSILGSLVAASDPDEGALFEDALERWDAAPTPFAGGSLGDMEVGAAALRTIRLLALQHEPHRPSVAARAWGRVTRGLTHVQGVGKQSEAVSITSPTERRL